MLAALPLTGLIAGIVSPNPVARADDAAGQVSPSDGPASAAAQPSARASSAPARSPAKQDGKHPPAPRAAAAESWAGRIPQSGSGKFTTAKVKDPLVGKVVGKKGRLLRYVVRVERELPFDTTAVARVVERVLSDRRSWAGSGQWRMQLVDDLDRAQFSVLVATPKTTDKYCLPLHTWGRLSCQDGPRAVLNARRWAFGASTYGKDVAGYRTYLVNHEVGHVLGFGHERCAERGARAPVMVQQTKSLQGCRKNTWPFPRA